MARLSKDDLLTRYAKEATDLSLEFVRVLGDVKLGAAEYRPELTAPESVSTSGGVQAQQNLRLISKSGAPPLVVGTVHVKEGRAELRTWERVDALHHRRFESAVPFEREAYDAFVDRAETFFRAQKLETAKIGATPSLFPPADEPEERRGMMKGVVLGATLAAIVALVLWIVLRK